VSNLPKSAAGNPLFILEMCKRHDTDAVRRMNFGPADKWRVALIILQILLWQRVMVSDAVRACKDDTEEINKKLKEVGCLACADESVYRLACRLIREKGLDHMVKVSKMEIVEPEWFAQ
jgi:hypothetical protein